MHLSGQKEILTATQKQQSEIEKSREEAAAARGEASIKGAEARAEIYAKSGEERARIAAAAAEKARQGVAKETAKQHLVEKFQEFNIVKKTNESDDAYIERAQGIAPEILGGQLAGLHRDYQSTQAQINKLTADSAASYPTRLAEAAWQHAKILIPDSVQKQQLDKLDPVRRETAIALLHGGDAKVIQSSYSEGIGQVQKTVQQFDPDTQVRIQELKNEAYQTADELAKKKADIRYASAIPEFLKQIKSPGAAADDDIDFSRMTPGVTPARPGAGAAPVAAGAPAARPFLLPGGAPSEISPVRTPGALPPTPGEVYGPGAAGYGWEPGQQTPLIGKVSDALGSAADAASRVQLMKPVLGAIDLAGASANQWVGTPQFSLLEAARRNERPPEFYENAPGRDTGFTGAYLQGMGLPRTMNPPARGLPPTPAEIAAFRAGVPSRRPVIATPVGGGVPLDIAAPGQGFVPTSLNRLNTEQQLLDNYVRGRAPAFDPTMVNVRTPAEITSGNAMRAMTEAASTNELRKRIARHPKTQMYPVSPLKDKLSTMNLSELQALYRQLGPE